MRRRWSLHRNRHEFHIAGTTRGRIGPRYPLNPTPPHRRSEARPVRAFSFSDTCDPCTPPRCLNLQARGPWTVDRGSFSSIRCPDTQRSTTRSTREPRIWTDPPRSDASWRKISERSRAVKSTGQLQGNYKTRTRLDIIPCYQWPKDRITRPRAPRISGQIAQFRGKSTGIRRPRPPCRPAGAWAMFLTNSCYKNDIGYNYAIISYFRGPDP